MSIALRILRWVFTLNVEGEVRSLKRKHADNPPPSSKSPSHQRRKVPIGFQPNPQYPDEAEAPEESEGTPAEEGE